VRSTRSGGSPTPHKRGYMDARNFAFMFYGFLAAWLIVLLYVVTLARRGARLKKELEDVKQLAKQDGSAEWQRER
jgi:CcmD family protein